MFFLVKSEMWQDASPTGSGDPICLRRFVFCPSAIHHIISALQHCSYPRPPTSKCSFAAFLPALVGLVTLQSVHATLSRNCRTASVSTIQPPSVTQLSISHTDPNVSSYIWFLTPCDQVVPQANVQMSSQYGTLPRLVPSVCCHPPSSAPLATLLLCSATKVNVLAPTLIGGGGLY